MELTNKREQYTVANADANVSLVGEVLVTEGTIISNFNGTLTKVSDSSPAGNSNYMRSRRYMRSEFIFLSKRFNR